MPSKPSYRARWVSYVIPIGLFLVMTSIVLLLARGYTFDLTDGIRKTGLIVLDSDPKNAYITVNNHVRPERTRATLKVSPGEYDVKVDLPGVHAWQKEIRLDPGQAELEEHILLFREQPGRAVLTPAAPVGQALSASGSELAFLQPGPGDVTLSTVRIKPDGADPAKTASGLPAAYAAPRSLDWSSDDSRLVVSAGDETRIVTPGDNKTVTLTVGGRVSGAPGQPDAAIIEPEPGKLVRADAEHPGGEPYESSVTAWTSAGDTVYVALTDGSLVRRSGASERRVISRTPALADLTAAAEDTGTIYGRDGTKTLYRVTDKGLEQLATDVDRYAVSRDGDQVVYLKQRELRLWDRNRDIDALLTRFTDPPTQLAVVPGGYYVLYGRAGVLHTIAADGTNDTVLATGVDVMEVINREQVLVRDQASGRSTALTILGR